MHDRTSELWTEHESVKERAKRTQTRLASAETLLTELEDRDRRRSDRMEAEQKDLADKYPTLRS
jgi:hypothetical protein